MINNLTSIVKIKIAEIGGSGIGEAHGATSQNGNNDNLDTSLLGVGQHQPLGIPMSAMAAP